jgi:hypothetical protein
MFLLIYQTVWLHILEDYSLNSVSSASHDYHHKNTQYSIEIEKQMVYLLLLCSRKKIVMDKYRNFLASCYIMVGDALSLK